MTTTILILLIMSLGMGVLDRYIGWGGHGRVKPVIASVVFLAGVGYLLGWPILAWATFPLAFLIWRTPGWKTLGGTMTPRTDKERTGTFARHLLVLPVIIPLYYAGIVTDLDATAWATFGLNLFALAATGYGMLLTKYYDKNPPKDINRFVEFFRGVTLGSILSAIILFV